MKVTLISDCIAGHEYQEGWQSSKSRHKSKQSECQHEASSRNGRGTWEIEDQRPWGRCSQRSGSNLQVLTNMHPYFWITGRQIFQHLTCAEVGLHAAHFFFFCCNYERYEDSIYLQRLQENQSLRLWIVSEFQVDGQRLLSSRSCGPIVAVTFPELESCFTICDTPLLIKFAVSIFS